MISPKGEYAPRAHDGILVLQRGENASTDYYLRSRLVGARLPFQIADLDTPPDRCALLREPSVEALLVIICRYASKPWLDALRASRSRLARVAYFLDDDLPAIMRDASLPHAVRSKVALHYGEHVEALGALASEVWVSSAVLADRYRAVRPRLLDPIPEEDPPEPVGPEERRVVYHGTDVHAVERRFVLDVARLLPALGCDARIEITGDRALRAACSDLPNVTVVPQLAWPDYRRTQGAARAAISLAPLFASEVNDARAPVKAYDAARLGAAGVFADAPAYRGFVRPGVDGLILPMAADAWARTIADLLADPPRRAALAGAARARLIDLRRGEPTFPAPMSA